MRKVIPVLCLTGAAAGTLMALFSFVFILVVGPNPALTGLTVFAVPLLVISTVTAGLTTLLNFLFIRDTLCRIGFFVGLIGVAAVIGGYITIGVI